MSVHIHTLRALVYHSFIPILTFNFNRKYLPNEPFSPSLFEFRTIRSICLRILYICSVHIVVSCSIPYPTIIDNDKYNTPELYQHKNIILNSSLISGTRRLLYLSKLHQIDPVLSHTITF